MNKCGDCKWLCGEERIIGIACLHPDRPFQKTCSNLAHYKYKSTRACKRFEQKKEEENHMIELVIPEPCKNCQGMWLAVKQPLTYIDSDGHMKQQPVEVYCVHEKVCHKLHGQRTDEQKLADDIRVFLDEHPNKAITVSMHMDGGEYKHIVEIQDRKAFKK